MIASSRIDTRSVYSSSARTLRHFSPAYVNGSRLEPGLIGLVIGAIFGMVDWSFAALFYLTAYGLGTALTAFTLILEDLSFHRYETARDRARLFGSTLIENFGYRQLIVFWRLRGMWKYLRGRKDWGAMERKGFTTPIATQ